ncbi:MAG: HEAT repeat domain-containing protein [Candidatus Euphemobacter frigidus]|nr:HEAT repeat domain-containing protein [Candidatus Euphemobacter frigidus]MDP8275779.1 HEAT repeat domain-containing protein [Candidatus Euphemobacter frigidus]
MKNKKLFCGFIIIIIVIAVFLFIFWKPLKEKSEEEYLYDRLKKSGLSGKKEIIDKFFKTTKLGNGSMEKYSKWAIIELKTGDQETEILALKVLAVTHRFVPPALEQSIVDNVIPMLKSENPKIQRSAVTILGYSGNRKSIPPIMNLLESEAEGVKGIAIMALWRLEPEQDSSRILQMYKKEKNDFDKWAYAVLLGMMGNPTGQEILFEHLGNEDDFHGVYSGIALIKLGNLSVIPITLKLIDEYETPWFYQEDALAALREVTGVSFNFDKDEPIDDPPEVRLKVVKNWINWWEENKDKLIWNPKKRKYISVR